MDVMTKVETSTAMGVAVCLINGCKYLRQLPDLSGDRHKLRCHFTNFVLGEALLTEVSVTYNT